MKRILIVSSVFRPEPVVSARISEELAIALSEDFKVDVLAPFPSRPKGINYSQSDLVGYGYNRIIADSYVYPESKFLGRMKESFSFGWATFRHIRKNKDYSIVYANTKPLFGVYFTLMACRICKIPLVLHIQDIYPESMFGRLRKMQVFIKVFILIDRFFYGYARKILVISENMKNYLSETRKIPGEKFLVVRNWQNLEYSSIVNNQANKTFTFMFAGSISPAAGVDFLIDSFVKASLSNAKLIIAGDGSMKSYCQEIVKKSGTDNIFFISLKPDEVTEVQKQADVLLLPLKKGVGKTASPSKLSAYMMSEKPIIACVDAGCDTEYVIHTAKCGIVTEAEHCESLISAMKKMMNLSSEELLQMGINGRLFAQKEMSKECNLKKIVNLIKSIVK